MIVKIVAASLCHADLQAVDGKVAIEGIARQTVPITLGHEGAGIIDTLGAGVAGFEEGDRVGFLYHRGACCKSLPRADRDSICPIGMYQLFKTIAPAAKSTSTSVRLGNNSFKALSPMVSSRNMPW
jgi:D-arabinose 1-dehydrogenase-like Zn-dependent alcohol dehydrogenase